MLLQGYTELEIEKFLKFPDFFFKFLGILLRELLQVKQFPFYGRIVLEILELITAPLGIAGLEAEQETLVCFCHQTVDIFNKGLPRFLELLVGEWDIGHSFKLIDHRFSLIYQAWRETLVDGAVTAKKTEDEPFTALGHWNIHIFNIEEITGMLTRQGSGYLSAVQLGDGDDTGFAIESELVLRLDTERHGQDITTYDATLRLVYLYLDLLASVFAQQLACAEVGHNMHPLEGFLRLVTDGLEMSVNIFDALLPV